MASESSPNPTLPPTPPPPPQSSSQPKRNRQQLSSSMEHIRRAVAVLPSTPSSELSSVSPSPSHPTPQSRAADDEPDSVYGVPTSVILPLRHAPSAPRNDNPQKRADPFQFGSRYLEEGDDIFAFNAWDNVEVDDAYLEFAEEMYQKQRENPVSDSDKETFNGNPDRYWNKFYRNNSANFFKDRKWLHQEFPILTDLSQPEAGNAIIVEVGAGAGNTAFPIMKHNRNPLLTLHACDFSRAAVKVMRDSPLYNHASQTGTLHASVWDAAAAADDDDDDPLSLPEGVAPDSVDVVLLIFIFSALAPAQWRAAMRNVRAMLKPGGTVLFRDYGRGDLAQLRFKKGRYLDENFYVRGDGTRVYFFAEEELRRLWVGEEGGGEGGADGGGRGDGRGTEQDVDDDAAVGETKLPTPSPASQPHPRFEVLDFGVDRRMLVNRQRRLKMYRCWMQARFRKPTNPSSPPSTDLQEHTEDVK